MKIRGKEVTREFEKDNQKFYQTEDGTWYKERQTPGGIMYPETEDPTKKDIFDDLSNVEILKKLNSINPMVLKPGFEMEFVMQFKQKFSRFGEKTFVSPKQREVLIRIIKTYLR